MANNKGKTKLIALPKTDPRHLRHEVVPGDQIVDIKEESSVSVDEAELALMRERITSANSYWEPSYDQAKQDLKFNYGDQWDDYTKKVRLENGRPILQLNLLPTYIRTVVGASRQQKISINVLHKSGPSQSITHKDRNKETYPLSSIIEGIIKDIEYRSKASTNYENALKHAAESGFGWLMVRTEREYDNPFYVDLKIEHIKDRFSVLMDPNSESPMLEDAEWGIIFRRMPMKQFKKLWPDAVPDGGNPVSTASANLTSSEYSLSSKSVTVYDYYFKQAEKRKALFYVNQESGEFFTTYEDEIDDEMERILETELGFELEEEKEVDSYKVKIMRCTSTTVLEPIFDFPGSRIPIVPVIGREVDMEGGRRWISLTHDAQDAQKQLNYWASAATERVGMAPKSSIIASYQQAGGGTLQKWEEQFNKPHPVILYNSVEGESPPQRFGPADLPNAEIQLLSLGKEYVANTIGIHDASIGRRSNEVSGIALQKRQEAGNTSVAEFPSNLLAAVQSLGDMLCELIPHYYDNRIVQRIILPNDSSADVHINFSITDQETGTKMRMASLKIARYSCLAVAGYHSDTQREEFVTMMTEWGRSDPEGFSIVRDLIVQNMNIPGGTRELSKRFRQLLPPNFLSEEEKQERGDDQPTAEQQAEITANQSKIEVAEGKVAEQQIQLDIENAKLQTAMIALEVKKMELVSRGNEQQQGGDDQNLESKIKQIMAKNISLNRNKKS